MKKRLLILAAMILAISSLLAQEWDENHKKQREQIASYKIAFITDQLRLTPEEAEKFWPLYNEFEEKRAAEQDELLEMIPGRRGPDPSTMSDEELDEFVLRKLQQEQNLINLKLTYYNKFKEVLPVRKVFKLYQSEMEFRKRLLERLRNKPPMRR
jgi:hypothetical protein